VKQRILTGLTVLLMILLPALPVRAAPSRPGLIAMECPEINLSGYTLECGMIVVPADHTAPGEEMFQIATVVVHRDGTNAAPDPLLFINGGPGGKTLYDLPLFVGMMEAYLQDRDVIFFDARGIGLSQPALDCPALDAVFLASAQSTGPGSDAVLDAAGACYDDLMAAGIDPGLFNSMQIAGDIAVMRTALGYDEWNLYGISYGTRTTMTVLRDHPEGVRSAILDAVLPPEANALVDGPANAERALDQLAADCMRDWLCSASYPDIQGTFLRVVRRLDAAPAILSMVLEDGSTRQVSITGAGFSDRVIGLLASARLAPSIPAIIYDADRGDFSAFEPMIMSLYEVESSQREIPSTQGQAFSTICAEEVPFYAVGAIDAAYVDHPLMGNRDGAVGLPDFCMVWPVHALPDSENQPVISDVPTLFGSGSYDSLLTPDYARGAAEGFTHAYVFEAPGMSHGVFNIRGCGSSIGRAFLRNPQSAPDGSCMAAGEAVSWIITAQVSRPVARVAGWLAVVAAVTAAGYGSALFVKMARRRRIAWHATLVRIGWWPLVASVVIAGGLYVFAGTMSWKPSPILLIAIATSLMTAIQVALALSPTDESALEIMLSLPQPYNHIKWGQLTLIFLQEGILAVAATMVLAAIEHLAPGAALLNWLAPMLFLSGLAALITVRTHQAQLAALMVIMGVFGIAIAGDKLLPVEAMGQPWSMPVGAIQPFIWILHPYLQPDSLTIGDYLANRAVVSGLGALMLLWALALMSRTERILMAHKGA
jgi:pimeloyl-ACP methyl ester carboxylesterase